MQFGNYSTILVIAHLHDQIINDTDNNKSVCALFLDLAKAFDTCNHKMLLFKLEQCQYGKRGVANDVIRSYLTNCKQFASGNGHTSSILNIKIRVTKDSVLGPILFIYISMTWQIAPISKQHCMQTIVH